MFVKNMTARCTIKYKTSVERVETLHPDRVTQYQGSMCSCFSIFIRCAPAYGQVWCVTSLGFSRHHTLASSVVRSSAAMLNFVAQDRHQKDVVKLKRMVRYRCQARREVEYSDGDSRGTHPCESLDLTNMMKGGRGSVLGEEGLEQCGACNFQALFQGTTSPAVA